MGYTVNEYIPMELWHKDHWSTLAYIEAVMVECKGLFQVGFDGRMRQNRRHFRIMTEQAPRPLRPSKVNIGVVMDIEHGTRLRNGDVVASHDDWCCVQDMVHNGFFETSGGVPLADGDMQPGVCLIFSNKGMIIAAQLRQHKMIGGTFSTFEPKLQTV